MPLTPLTSCEGDSSYGAREDELNDLSMSVSYNEFNGSFAETRKNELVIDQAITGLKKCMQLYKEKARSCENQLELLGFTATDLPESLRTDLKEVLKDGDGVFQFPCVGNELVTINADHILDSLQENYELGQLRLLRSQMGTLVEEHSRLNNHLQRKLSTEKDESTKLENKRFEKEANLMIFNEKLEAAKWELSNLQQLSKGNQKLKYSMEDLESLKQEIHQLKADIAYTDVKLNRYNKLPLSEKDALKQLAKMREEMKNVDNEIKSKVKM